MQIPKFVALLVQMLIWGVVFTIPNERGEWGGSNKWARGGWGWDWE